MTKYGKGNGKINRYKSYSLSWDSYTKISIRAIAINSYYSEDRKRLKTLIVSSDKFVSVVLTFENR